MEQNLFKLCRTCGKQNFSFCNINHEVVNRLMKFIPFLLDATDQSLPSDVCIQCYQMIKTLVFNIEGIMDMQKILKMQIPSQQIHIVSNNGKSSTVNPEIVIKAEKSKRMLVEDIAKKYTNIKVRKLSMENSPSKTNSPTPIATPKIPPKTPEKSPIVLISDSPDDTQKRTRSFMCISCSEKFQKFTILESHLKVCKASSTQQLKCFCGEILTSKEDLSTHVKIKHKQNKQVSKCAVCSKIFSTLLELQNHLKLHKSPPRSSFLCQFCNGKFFDLVTLKEHRDKCKQRSNEC